MISHLLQGAHPVALVYGNRTFTAMTELERRIVELGRVRGVLGALARHPTEVLAVLLAVWRLPRVQVPISPAHAAAWFSRDFPLTGGPIFGGHLAQAVLDLTPDDQTYLAGRRKQALRTNLRHGRNHGVQAISLSSYNEWASAARDIIRSGPGGEQLIEQMHPPPVSQDLAYFIAADADGRPVAFDVAALFNDCAALIWSMSLPDHPARSSARYVLHTFMRSTLRCRGMRDLIAGRTGGSPGLHYFQYLLGYEVCNLRITVRDAADLPAEPSPGRVAVRGGVA